MIFSAKYIAFIGWNKFTLSIDQTLCFKNLCIVILWTGSRHHFAGDLCVTYQFSLVHDLCSFDLWLSNLSFASPLRSAMHQNWTREKKHFWHGKYDCQLCRSLSVAVLGIFLLCRTLHKFIHLFRLLLCVRTVLFLRLSICYAVDKNIIKSRTKLHNTKQSVMNKGQQIPINNIASFAFDFGQSNSCPLLDAVDPNAFWSKTS